MDQIEGASAAEADGAVMREDPPSPQHQRWVALCKDLDERALESCDQMLAVFRALNDNPAAAEAMLILRGVGIVIDPMPVHAALSVTTPAGGHVLGYVNAVDAAKLAGIFQALAFHLAEFQAEEDIVQEKGA